jgi:tetratricopeptide (TPR) repeat protein
VRLALQGTRSNRDALGAEVELIVERAAGTVRDRRTLKGSSSYLAQSERRLTFGLGEDGRPAGAEVTWPSGRREAFRDVPVNREVLLVEGTGAEIAPAPGLDGAAPAPENPVAARERGRVGLEAGRLDEAITALAAALRLDPHDLAAHRLRLIALERAGRRGELDAAVGEAVRAFPDAHIQVAHFAIVLREGGHPQLARRFFAAAVELDPRRPDAWTALGNLAYDARSYEEALAAYRRVLAIDPDAVEALTNTGKVHALRKEFAEAVPWLERAVAIRPDSAAALSTLGGVLIESGDLDRAEDLLSRALKARAPRETLLTVHGNLGILYLKRRDRARAIASFEQVLALDPADVRAREALEKLRR